jgi:type IV secretory pathway TrbF-like protein
MHEDTQSSKKLQISWVERERERGERERGEVE